MKQFAEDQHPGIAVGFVGGDQAAELDDLAGLDLDQRGD